MLDQIKSTSKNSIVYGLGNVSVKLVGLILIPIYTDPAYLSFDDYGILGILESTSLVVAAWDLHLFKLIQDGTGMNNTWINKNPSLSPLLPSLPLFPFWPVLPSIHLPNGSQTCYSTVPNTAI